MSNHVTGFPNAVLGQGDLEMSLKALKEFNAKNGNAFIFGNYDADERKKFTSHLLELFGAFTEEKSTEGIDECLASLVVMSRDQSSVTGRFVSKEIWDSLVEFAGLHLHSDKGNENLLIRSVVTHACKCLCNVIYLTKDSKGFCNDDSFLEGLMKRLNDFDPTTSDPDDLDLEFLTLRFLFLVTVLNPDARTKVVEEYECRRTLIEYLGTKIGASEKLENPTPLVRRQITLSHAKSCSEILRTLFNVNIKEHNEENQVREEKITLEFADLTSVCRKCFLLRVKGDEATTEKIHSDAGNCMYSVPASCFLPDNFVPVLMDQKEDDPFSYMTQDAPLQEDRDMSTVSVIINSVERKIEKKQLSTESLQPVLSLLSHLSRTSRNIRKYCKERVIPPRRDFEHRPEVGPEFQNKLIKLFTNANTEVKGAAADFVFVLCKEKVDRLVKYTGYGNSAGLLASRGLLAGGRGDTIYSDTDSDSDTEEYKESADKINPITGHVPPPMPNPMEGMSDEQKEYLAVQLANQISKLSEADVFQPVCIDEKTGKLVPFRQKVHNTEIPEEKDSDDSD